MARRAGVGDTLLNYRYQALMEGPGRPAFSPRASLVLPIGQRQATASGNGSYGLQVNLPFSKQTGDWSWHWNAGLTWLPRAEASFQQGDLRGGTEGDAHIAIPGGQQHLPTTADVSPDAGIGAVLRSVH